MTETPDKITDDFILNMGRELTITPKGVEERFSYLLTSLSLDMFIHEILMLMSKYPNESVGTMGIAVQDNMIKLLYAPSFLGKLTDKEGRWVITHEILHVVFHHCTVRMSEDPRMRRLQSIAADMAINQLIPTGTGMMDQPRKEVINIILPEMYGFPPKLSMEQYYLLLLEKFDPNKPQPQKGEGDPKDGEDEGEGSGTGEEQGEDKGNGGKSSKGSDSKDGEDYLPGDLVDSHEGWSDKDAGLVESIIKDAIENWEKSGKKWGSISGGCKEMILAAQKSEIKWWKILRDYMGHMVSKVKTTTMKRPHRRYGYPYPGKVNKSVDKILIGADSSLSISGASFGHFISEANMIAEVHPVDFVIFDTEIVYGPIPLTRRIRRLEVPGRGGTDFEAIFKLAESGKYKSVVILTDGIAPAVDYPKGVRDVIWCIVGGGKPPVDWGKVIHIKESQSVIG